MTTTTREGVLYREPAREPLRRLRYGPFVPDPGALVLTLALTSLAAMLVPQVEVSVEIECTREHAGDTPRCERRTRRLVSRDHVETTPAILERLDGSASLPNDVLRFDGLTLMLPNNPPGPLSDFLAAPAARHVRTAGDVGVPTAFPILLLVIAAFFAPRVLLGVLPRLLVVDRSARRLHVRTPSGRIEMEIAFDEIERVDVETFGDDAVSRLRGGRLVIERTDGTVVPLVPHGRPLLTQHEAMARELTKALGLTRAVATTYSTTLRSAPPMRSSILLVQVATATLALAAALTLVAF